jgi:biotin-(acetyl-CoA carboxylase) ligase
MPQVRTPSRPKLDLPPPFRLVMLREVGDAFAHAQSIAAEEGAGTLVFVGRFDLVEFAVVLEPDEPLRVARRAIYAGLAALADALASHAPPEKPISFVWPDAILVDGGLVGGARLAWPAGAAEDQTPDWLVFGATIRTVAMSDHEPGLRPLAVALEEEGFDELGSGALVESFARHLMLMIDAWQNGGFGEVAQAYLSRLPGDADLERLIDGSGDLLVRRAANKLPERHRLVPALATPSWLDRQTGGPRT